MTTKRKAQRAAKGKLAPKLSHPANARRLATLAEQDTPGGNLLAGLLAELRGSVPVAADLSRRHYLFALREVETGRGDEQARALHRRAQEILTRLDAGEALDAIATERQPPDEPQTVRYRRTEHIDERAMPYTLAERETIDAEACARWAAERAPRLVELLMPISGLMNEMDSDDAGAALMEIVSVLTYADADERENLHTDLTALVFSLSSTYEHESGDFASRRLVFEKGEHADA